ncbi:hypothetical protein LTR72_008915 [Exophiala xenobiotica]|nr:hypothetical protein LTR72_008915 [Exophiala xenobiotica]KAK5289965.1 hypothetical protein LTR14_006981 [Exophiala xenobiotica]KAK5478941.1 hypothetical protein LTR55_007739 [Exophiala xenobiotica]
MTTNPTHLYRSLLREASYLPLPQCRTFIKSHITTSFRRYIPKYHKGTTRTGNPNPFSRQVELLHRGRKFLAGLKRANEGYILQLEKVLRMTYGRIGPRRYTLLDTFTSKPAPTSSDELASSPANSPTNTTPTNTTTNTTPTTTPSTTTPAQSRREAHFQRAILKWDIPPRLKALLKSQTTQQSQFLRIGRRTPNVHLRFKPPSTNIWGKPLPMCRLKNLKHEWYNSNVELALPPLPPKEYNDLHDLVSGKTKITFADIPSSRRRPQARRSTEDQEQEEAASQSSIILEGPKPGIRMKDYMSGRPHTITPRLLRHLLSRCVLKETPLVKTAVPERSRTGLAFRWDDARSSNRLDLGKMNAAVTNQQMNLLFG